MAADIDGILGPFTDLVLSRLLERAGARSWASDLDAAGAAVYGLTDDLRRQTRAGRATGAAGECLEARVVAEADGWIRRAMGEAGDAGTARREFCLGLPPSLRALLALAFGPGATAGRLGLAELEEVARRLVELKLLVQASAKQHPAKGPIGVGRPRDVAAERFVEALEATGFPKREAARMALQEGVERASSRPGADPIKQITDRWGAKKRR